MSLESVATSHRRRRSRGQSLVELALILPLFLLFILMTIDFGRVFLGWINLQNMARIAANYAANNPEAWSTPDDATKQAKQARYIEIVANDAKVINCDIDGSGGGGVRPPLFASGTSLGDLVEVNLGCRFAVITPVISQIVGGTITLEASAVSPVRTGTVPSIAGGGGGPIAQAPTARFVASPLGGYAQLTVQFTDSSLRRPTSWTWSFGDGDSSFDRDPVHTYSIAGTYTVSLTVQNSGGFDSVARDGLIIVDAAPTAGPIPEFTATPRSGSSPLSVRFTDRTVGTVTSHLWNFGDGATSNQQDPIHSYSSPESYTVSLTVSDGVNPPNTQTKVAFVLVNQIPCRVPNFFNTKKNGAQTTWAASGFTTQVQPAPGQGNYTIKTQSLAAGTVPDADCAAAILVGP